MGVNAFYYGDEVAQIMQEIVELWRGGKIQPPVEAEYGFDDAPAIFQRLAERKVRGRAVITAPTREAVPPHR